MARNRLGNSDTISKWLLYVQVLGATFLQKIAIPVMADTRIFLGLFLIMAVTCIGIASKRLEIRKSRCLLYLLMTGTASLTQLLGGNEFSLLSLALLFLIHLPYIFGLKDRSVHTDTALAFFQNIMVFIAVLGLMQFGLQYLIEWKYAFFMDTQLPSRWVISGFNNINAIKYGSHFHKSNGVFMLEPAEFCQFLALSIIIEMIYFKRHMRLALYSAAILTTFSGTGLIILALIVPAWLLHQRHYKTIGFIATVLLVITLTAPLTGLDDYTGRVSEFSDSHTSGYARFISIFPLLYEFTLSQPDTLLLGHGAGWIKTIYDHVSYEIHPPGWGKIWLEYGLIGLVFYMAFMLTVLWDSTRDNFFKAAMTIEYFFDDYILIPTVHGLILALLAWPPKHGLKPAGQ